MPHSHLAVPLNGCAVCGAQGCSSDTAAAAATASAATAAARAGSRPGVKDDVFTDSVVPLTLFHDEIELSLPLGGVQRLTPGAFKMMSPRDVIELYEARLAGRALPSLCPQLRHCSVCFCKRLGRHRVWRCLLLSLDRCRHQNLNLGWLQLPWRRETVQSVTVRGSARPHVVCKGVCAPRARVDWSYPKP